jgi:hypothetical protein
MRLFSPPTIPNTATVKIDRVRFAGRRRQLGIQCGWVICNGGGKREYMKEGVSMGDVTIRICSVVRPCTIRLVREAT